LQVLVMAGKFKKGARCSGACQTKDHRTFGECMRAKNLKLSPAVNGDYGTRQAAWDKELDSYESAVKQGIQPRGTKQAQVDDAIRRSEETGKAFIA